MASSNELFDVTLSSFQASKKTLANIPKIICSQFILSKMKALADIDINEDEEESTNSTSFINSTFSNDSLILYASNINYSSDEDIQQILNSLE